MEEQMNGKKITRNREMLPIGALDGHLKRLGLDDAAASIALGKSRNYIAEARRTGTVSKTAVLAAEGLVRRLGKTVAPPDSQAVDRLREAVATVNAAADTLGGRLVLSIDASSGKLRALVEF